jgi:hypothetical protein
MHREVNMTIDEPITTNTRRVDEDRRGCTALNKHKNCYRL